MENSHIEEYLENFIYDAFNPKFGVLLKGDWGSGKTYLVNNLIERLDETKITKNEIISISLYGVDSISQITDKVYQAYHPILSSPEFQFAGRILASAIKLNTTIDLNNDGKSDGSISFGGLGKKKKIKVDKIKKKLLLVDDLERCNLPLSSVLGYFSEYILQDDIKTIFIGNEEKTYDEDEKDSFKTIKEKIIGIEFTVKPDIRNSIVSFIEELSLQKYNSDDVLIEECEAIIKNLKINNMRNVRQGFFNLKYLLEILPETATEEYIRNIIKVYMVVFLQKCSNIITEQDVNESITAYEEYSISYKDYNSDREKYSNLFINITIPLDGLWSDIVFHGKYLKHEIIGKYENDIISTEEELEKNDLLFMISNWRNLSEDEFKSKLNSLNKKFYNFEYPQVNQILHYANILLCFSNWSLIPETKENILQNIKEFIKEKEEDIIPVQNDSFMSFSYGSYALSDNTPGLEEIKNIAININKKNEAKLKIKDLDQDIKSLEGNVSNFCKNIYHVNGNGKYYKISILSKIDINDFFNEFIKLHPDDQRHIFYALSERYGSKYSNGSLEEEYFDDYEPLKTFQEKYESEIGELNYNPKKVLMNQNNENLKKLLEYMKGQIEK